VLDNKVPRGIFWSKREEVTIGRIQLYTEWLRGLYSSPDTHGCSNKDDEMGGACGTLGGEKSMQRFDEEI
jgi:hypothetical protein